jgi:pantoate kinase
MTLLEQLAQERTHAVISTAVSVAIEKMAEEAAREILQDPSFRAELKAAARQSFGRAIRDLRRARKPTKRP